MNETCKITERVNPRGLVPFTKNSKNMYYFKRHHIWPVVMFITSLVFFGFSLKLIADETKKQQNSKFNYKGKAFLMQNGTIDIIIQNTSPEGSDYFVVSGDVIIDDLTDENSENVLKMSINPTIIGGGMFIRLAASKEKNKLLLGEQMLRMEVRLPDKYKSSRINFVEINLTMFKTPIKSKKIVISRSVVKMSLLK